MNMDVNEEYRAKQRLLSDITPWWKQNGWSITTLNSKSHNELLGIRSRMLNTKKADCRLGVSRKGQVRIYN